MNIEKRMAKILQIQQKAIMTLIINQNYTIAMEKICNIQQSGHTLITIEMGKVGIVAQKMSATMASIGCFWE